MKALLIALVIVAVAHGYVLLRNRAFVKLQDFNGGYSLNSSTYNRIAYDTATNLLFVTGESRVHRNRTEQSCVLFKSLASSFKAFLLLAYIHKSFSKKISFTFLVASKNAVQ